MVKTSVLEKLRDAELMTYIAPESRFTPDAIEYASSILRERGHLFSDEETSRIKNLIESKRQKTAFENSDNKNRWDKNLTSDETAIKLYTNKVIWVFSILFGVIFGAVLQSINFAKISKKKGLYFSLAFGVIYTIIQIFLVDYIEEIYNRKSTFFFSLLGVLGLHLIHEKKFPKDKKYQAKSFVVPLLVAVLIYAPIVYFTIFRKNG